MDCSPPGCSVHGTFQARTLVVVEHLLLQGIFSIQGSKLPLLHLLWWQVDFYRRAPREVQQWDP